MTEPAAVVSSRFSRDSMADSAMTSQSLWWEWSGAVSRVSMVT